MGPLNVPLCEVCHSRVVGIVSRPDVSIGSHGRCFECGLLQYLGLKRPSELEGVNFDGYLLAQDLTFEKTRRSTVLLQLQKLLALNNLDLSVFDIGTGSGHFLYDAQQLGFKVSGSELSYSAASLVNRKYGFEIFVKNYEDLGFTNCHSAVTMFCVLAHSVNPDSLLKSIHRSLQVGGVLYFHTPKYCLIDSVAIALNKVSNGRMNHLLLRRIGGDHRRIYTRKSLTILLEKSGFSEFNMTPEIGYGLKKENYFTAMGLPQTPSRLLASALNMFSKLNLLPRNVFTVYATKRS
jgi:SAM-dependent methyltransferase